MGLGVKQVLSVGRLVSKGAFNPYTLSGSIVVDGVAASVHSEWVLDAFMPETWQRWLPAVYQGLFFPGRVLYGVAGSQAADALDMNNPQRTPDGHGQKFMVAVGSILVAMFVAVSFSFNIIHVKLSESKLP